MTTIMVLDDNQMLVDVLCETLEFFGYQTLWGRNGFEGIDLLSNTDPLPDLIICDMRMPKMDGLSFISLIRLREEWSLIPVLLLSSSNFEHVADRIPHVEFIEKPYRVSHLSEVIQNLLATHV